MVLGITILFTLNLLYSQTSSVNPEKVSPTVSGPEPTVRETNKPKKEIETKSGIVYEVGDKKFVSSDVKFTIQASDEGSGVKSIYVMLDDSQFGVYESPISFIEEGKHLIAYKIEDNVGNISPIKTYEFILDKTPPNTILSLDKRVVKIGDVIYVNTNYIVSLSAEDKLSGVKEIKYALNDGEEKSYSSSFNISGNAGNNTIKYYAIDNVGNISTTKSYTYFLDLIAPEVSIQIDPTPFVKDNKSFISESSQVKIVASDKETYIDKIFYSINNSEYQEYKLPLKFKSGSYSVKAKAVDILGNESKEVSVTFDVDGGIPSGDVIPTNK